MLLLQEEEYKKCGIYFADGYNYMKHLKPVNEVIFFTIISAFYLFDLLMDRVLLVLRVKDVSDVIVS